MVTIVALFVLGLAWAKWSTGEFYRRPFIFGHHSHRQRCLHVVWEGSQ